MRLNIRGKVGQPCRILPCSRPAFCVPGLVLCTTEPKIGPVQGFVPSAKLADQEALRGNAEFQADERIIEDFPPAPLIMYFGSRSSHAHHG